MSQSIQQWIDSDFHDPQKPAKKSRFRHRLPDDLLSGCTVVEMTDLDTMPADLLELIEKNEVAGNKP